jgi:outer membrane biosynthesis protein TonB
MVEQEAVTEPEPKPDEPEPPKAADEPPAAVGTNVQGDGPPDGFGLSGGNGTGGIGGTSGTGKTRKTGSQWGWYAGMVQTQVGDAIRKNSKTRAASLEIKLRLWADTSGRIERVAMVGTSGDAALDAALRNEVLTGLRLSEPPPADMPMPIVMRIVARRPN